MSFSVHEYWPVSAPCGASINGEVVIDEFVVTQPDADFFNRNSTSYTRIQPGTFKRLAIKTKYGFETVMSNTRMEILTNSEFVDAAHGNILINGLGLGMVIEKLLEKPSVNHITVIEKNPAVIELVSGVFLNNSKIEIINDCAFSYTPRKDSYFDFVWHDIWTDISDSNLAEMKLLTKKYKKISGWQGCWAKDLCVLVGKGYRI